jgi:hypothetical protein
LASPRSPLRNMPARSVAPPEDSNDSSFRLLDSGFSDSAIASRRLSHLRGRSVVGRAGLDLNATVAVGARLHPSLFRVGWGELARIEIEAGLAALIGGKPAHRQWERSMHWPSKTLALTPLVSAQLCNIATGPGVLLFGQLARLAVRAIQPGAETPDLLAARLAFVRRPFDLELER